MQKKNSACHGVSKIGIIKIPIFQALILKFLGPDTCFTRVLTSDKSMGSCCNSKHWLIKQCQFKFTTTNIFGRIIIYSNAFVTRRSNCNSVNCLSLMLKQREQIFLKLGELSYSILRTIQSTAGRQFIYFEAQHTRVLTPY